METQDYTDVIKKAQQVLAEQLSKKSWRPMGPIRRKLLELIFERLNDAIREFESRENLPGHCWKELAQLSKLINHQMTERVAWFVADELKALLPQCATSKHLYRQLSLEIKRDSRKGMLWQDLFEIDELTKLMDDFDAEREEFKSLENRNLATLRLSSLYQERNGIGRHNRARSATRTLYVTLLSIILTLFLIPIVFVENIIPDLSFLSSDQMLISLVSGALGATISRALQIRDLGTISEIKEVWTSSLAQILIGAALASIVLIILSTGLIDILGIGDSAFTIPDIFLVGFLVGFSEPLAIGILDRISGKAGSSSP